MVIKVGINGFGRIGRIVCRACLQNSALQLSAINDPAITVEYVSYLIKFDSTHGKLNGIVTYNEDEIVIDGQHIKVFHEKLPSNVPWTCADVQYVVEASGMFTNCEKASGHLASNGVKRVIVTAPSNDIPMVILGVNDCNLCPECKVISSASSTLYCLAPIIKVLEDHYGVEEGFVTSIHAMTPSLKPLDGLCLRGRHWRDHRSIHQNIIPAATGACKALGKILPQVKDKLSGLAFRVPIVNVSVLDLTIRLQINTTLQDIVKSVQQASNANLNNIIKVSSDESVSSDFFGETFSCIFDENSSIQLKPNFFKLICWYENEYSYACRIVDTLIFSDEQSLEISKKVIDVRHMSIRKPSVTQKSKCLKKEVCVVCNCKVEYINNNSEITSRTETLHSNFSTKYLSVVNPILQTHTNTKADELIKIRNDTTGKLKPSSPNECSVFQSCTGVTPHAQTKVECNTQARLENVKREFTKMVSITENLLKKTYNSQSRVRSISKDAIKGLNEINLKRKDILKKESDKITKCESYGPFEEYGECKSSADFSNASQTHVDSKDDSVSEMSYDKEKLEYSDCYSAITKPSKHIGDIIESVEELIDSNTTRDYKVDLTKVESYRHNWNNRIINPINGIEKEKRGAEPSENRKTDISMPDNHLSFVKTGDNKVDKVESYRHSENIASQNEDNDFKQATKTISTSNAGLSQNGKVKRIWNNRIINPINGTEKEIIGTEPSEKRKIDISIPDSPLSIEIKNHDIVDERFRNEEQISLKVNKRDTNKEKSSIKIIDDELKKRNIVLVDNSFVDELRDDNEQREIEVNKDYDLAKASAKDTLPETILERKFYLLPPTVKIIPDTSKYPTTSNTGISIKNVYKKRLDIYDKLDSASESNSNISFEINETKSQVIQITDLTNSLEDLSRLDQICRIIEVSDELSDKLFSALDDCHGSELRKKKWSFKDLCTRIKLDEFCKKVYGGSV